MHENGRFDAARIFNDLQRFSRQATNFPTAAKFAPVGMVGSPTEGDENRVQATASTRKQRMGRRSQSPIFEGVPELREPGRHGV
jgi:hypothetical protein